MNVQRHYDDERLIEILESERDLSGDIHLSACHSCREALESYRAITGVLREKSAWKLEPEPKNDDTLAALRLVSASMRDEDNAAAAMIDEITVLPRPWWAKKVAAEARFQTAALARALTAKSEEAIRSMPPDAVELARAATIAGDAAGDRLSIGTAYRQFAYALFYTGDIAGALRAIESSAEALASTASSEYELARLDIVRSVVFTAQENYEEALAAARSAQGGFRRFGDRRRLASALSGEAYVLLSQLRYRDALPVLTAIERDYNADVDPDTRARVIGNIGLCYWQTGHIAEALQAYELSAVLHESRGTDTEAARMRLNVAGLLSAEGQHREAKARLLKLREEFRNRGMYFEMVFAGVVVSEILLTEGDYEQVEILCRSAIEVFQKSGGVHQSQVLTALSYLHEASVLRRATPDTARHVHQYIERLSYEPNLLFAPPPLSPE